VLVALPLRTSEALQTLSSMRENATTAEAFAYHCRDNSYLSGRQVYGVLMPFERLFGPYALYGLTEDSWQDRLALKSALAEEA